MPSPPEDKSRESGPQLRRAGISVALALAVIAIVVMSAWRGPARGGADGVCEVDPARMVAAGCEAERSDTVVTRDPEEGLWGRIDCEARRRVGFHTTGGDASPTAIGSRQGNASYRRLRVVDGDDVYGERCELGRNESRNGLNSRGETDGTFALYGEGDRSLTFFSQRFRAGLDPRVPSWQTIAQMKQTQPSDDADGTPIVELQAYDGRLRLSAGGSERWTTRAPDARTWTRYALDVDYSVDPDLGSVRIFVDLNADGDALDRGERSPLIHAQTLKFEQATGAPLESHLRLGVYHDPALPCPAPRGCALDIDNVQVLEPGGA